MNLKWDRGPVLITRRGVNYAIRWLPKYDRKFWNAGFMPTEYLTSHKEEDKRKPNRKGRYVSLGFYFFAFYRGY
jgi:hypothetical protein